MSVDVFGRQLTHSKDLRGPPGVGYKLTADGQYDVESKRLCNIADPQLPNDAVNYTTLKNLIDSEIYNTVSDMRKLLEHIESSIQMLKSENDDERKSLNNVESSLQVLENNNAEQFKKVDIAINQLYDMLFQKGQTNIKSEENSGSITTSWQ